MIRGDHIRMDSICSSFSADTTAVEVVMAEMSSDALDFSN